MRRQLEQKREAKAKAQGQARQGEAELNPRDRDENSSDSDMNSEDEHVNNRPGPERRLTKQEKQAQYQEKLRLRREEKQKEREKIQEIQLLKAEEEKAQEDQEFNHWKTQFNTTAEGEDFNINEQQNSRQDSEEEMNRFIEFIKANKVVGLDEVGAEFQIKTELVLERIKILEKAGKLNGILDHRGKYIHLTLTELDKIARYINDKGRGSIKEFVKQTNNLVDLSPTSVIAETISAENVPESLMPRGIVPAGS